MRDNVLEKVETEEVELLDIIDEDLKFRDLKFHWTTLEDLPSILRRGFYSEKFAKKVGDRQFKRRSKGFMHEVDLRYTNVSSDPGPHIEIDPQTDVALIVRDSRPRNVYFRVAPRKFMGVVIYDQPEHGGPDWSEESSLSDRLGRLTKALEQEGKIMPVYGTSGNMYRPRRISHKEIVQMLRERDGQSSS